MKKGDNCRKRKDGRWEARIIVGRTEEGKAIHKSVYGRTYREVQEKKRQLIIELYLSREVTETKEEIEMSFSELASEYIKDKQDQIKETTYIHYNNLLETHILPNIGDKKISEIDKELIDEYLRHELYEGRIDKKGGLSPKTVIDIRSLLLMILSYAKKYGYDGNEIQNIMYPRNNIPQIKVFTKSELLLLESVLFSETSFFNLGVALSLYCGIRIGELCALTWDDIDLRNYRINISKTMVRIKNMDTDAIQKTRIIITRPKTEKSIREIPIPEFLYEYVNSLRAGRYCYVLTGTKSYMEPRTLENKYKRMLRSINLSGYNYHALRHTFATRCVEAGFDIKTLSEILGHSNVNTTMQRYVHPSLEQKHIQMNKLQRANSGIE